MDASPLARSPRPPWGEGSLIGGRYRLSGKIGAGAMGEVWRADHVSLESAVAVKLVDTTGRDDAAEMLHRFQQEARAAARLHSAHVVQILDHGHDGPVAFIAMELLEGESLEHRLERRGALLPSEVAHTIREMARGVASAHEAGILHRDLKPANVFICRREGREVVKVLDFGVAKILGAPREAHLQTQQGYVVGTPAYMSPEQVLGRPLDLRSDLWQIAVIAFECLTGKRPYEGETLGQLFLGICSGPPPVPSAIAKVPAGFDAWFAKAVDAIPSRRFESATELADELAEVLAPSGVGEAAFATIASTHANPQMRLGQPPRPGLGFTLGTAPPVASPPGAPSPSPSPVAPAAPTSSPAATARHVAWSPPEAPPPPRPRAATTGLLAVIPVVLLAAVGGVYWGLHHAPASPLAQGGAVPLPSSMAPKIPTAAVSVAAPVRSASTPLSVASAKPPPSASAAPVKLGGPRPTSTVGHDPDLGF